MYCIFDILECQRLSELDVYKTMTTNNPAKERWKTMSKVVSLTDEDKTSPLNSPKLRRRLDSLIGSKPVRRSSSLCDHTTDTLSELFSRIATEERKQAGGNGIFRTTMFYFVCVIHYYNLISYIAIRSLIRMVVQE